jgi:serine/threonine-protein kinase
VADRAQDDEIVMSLVEKALACTPDQREAFVRASCGCDTDLFIRVWGYVQWDERMNGFLADALFAPESDDPFEPAELLDDRFRIVRKVAEGGMGVVYEAVDEKLERRVALKCAKIGFRKRLPPEVRNATEISHPNVCKIFEIHTACTRQGEIDFLTMEFLEGETLADRLRSGPLGDEEARAIAQQLCAGLAEAHRNQVIHGDLKSNNVILTRGASGATRAVITDFGLARRSAANQPTQPSGTIGGTPDYMAPELWSGSKPSVSSDIYALGVLLYQLVSGRLPYGQEEPWNERLSSKPQDVNPKWDRILQRCLDPNPARRFQDADQIAAAMAPPARRWLIAAIAAVALAVASGVVTYERATAPLESIRLAVLPFESDRNTAAMAEVLFRDVAGQLGQLRGGDRAKLTVLPASKIINDHVDSPAKARRLLGATHVLHAAVSMQNKDMLLHAYFTDARSGVTAKEWTANYAPGQERFAPLALAGIVTGTLHLRPLTANITVNGVARQDYENGLTYVRRDSGVDTALAFMERAVAGDPDSPLTHAGLAEASWFKYFLTKDRQWLDRATESARQAELRDTDAAPLHRIAGILRANAGQYEMAEAEYRRAIELEPTNGDAYRRLGMTLEQNNQPEDALAAYRKALEAEPNYYRTNQALGSFYFNRANYTEAVRYFSKTVELAPDEPNGHFALGSAFTNVGRFADAESEFRFAIRLQETPTALHALGLVLMYEGEDSEAISYFVSALKLNPDRLSSWTELGNCYRRTNRTTEAERANRRALELADAEMAQNPRDGYVRSFLAYLCARLGDRQRAESEIAQALQLSSNGANTEFMAAVTYEGLGMRDATLSVLTTASVDVLADLSRWPDVADLGKDPRFLKLLASNQRK